MKKLTALLLTAAMVVTMFVVAPLAVNAADAIGAKNAGAASGSPTGTAISSWADISNMEGTYYLTADITASSTLGEFKGTLDGNGKTITASAPLFEKLNGATIKNVKIVSTFEVNATTASDPTVTKDCDGKNLYAAGAVAQVVNGGATIDNVKVTATITVPAEKIAADHFVSASGFVGVAVAGDMTFTNCELNGSIVNNTLTTADKTDGYASGFWFAQTGFAGNVTMTNCTNNAALTGNNKTAGFAGDTRDAKITVKNCLNAGNLNVASNSGGLFGYLGGNGKISVDNSKNTGKITQVGSAGAVGGIVAKADCKGTDSVVIKNCINAGELTYSYEAGKEVESNNDNASGGILGAHRNGGDVIIDNCKNTANISKWGANAGGIVGAIKGIKSTTDPLNISITNCTNSGNVTTSGSRAAGIVATFFNSGEDVNVTGDITIKDCSNSGTISAAGGKDTAAGIFAYPNVKLSKEGQVTIFENLTNTGTINGTGGKAGGIMGYGNFTGFNTGSMTFKNCTNKGKVTDEKELAGGICGQFKAAASTGTYDISFINCDNKGEVNQLTPFIENKLANSGGIIGNLEVKNTGKTVIDGCDNSGDVNVAGMGNIAGIVARIVVANGTIEIKNSNNSGKLTDTNTDPIMKDDGQGGQVVDETKNPVCTYTAIAPTIDGVTITTSVCKHEALCSAPTECVLCHATGVEGAKLIHNYNDQGVCSCGAEKPVETGDNMIFVLVISMVALLGTAITVSVKRHA